jgi:probable rRNA maturation factor
MRHSVAVYAEPGLGVYRRGLARAARTALQHQLAEAGSLTVLLAGTTHMQQLNCTFLGADRPTDVLSFPAGEGALDATGRYFGDLALCVPVALKQAARYRRDPAEELRLLVVHGVLHLLDLDHDTPARRRQMWRVQNEILSDLREGNLAHHAAA